MIEVYVVERFLVVGVEWLWLSREQSWMTWLIAAGLVTWAASGEGLSPSPDGGEGPSAGGTPGGEPPRDPRQWWKKVLLGVGVAVAGVAAFWWWGSLPPPPVVESAVTVTTLPVSPPVLSPVGEKMLELLVESAVNEVESAISSPVVEEVKSSVEKELVSAVTSPVGEPVLSPVGERAVEVMVESAVNEVSQMSSVIFDPLFEEGRQLLLQQCENYQKYFHPLDQERGLNQLRRWVNRAADVNKSVLQEVCSFLPEEKVPQTVSEALSPMLQENFLELGLTLPQARIGPVFENLLSTFWKCRHHHIISLSQKYGVQVTPEEVQNLLLREKNFYLTRGASVEPFSIRDVAALQEGHYYKMISNMTTSLKFYLFSRSSQVPALSPVGEQVARLLVESTGDAVTSVMSPATFDQIFNTTANSAYRSCFLYESTFHRLDRLNIRETLESKVEKLIITHKTQLFQQCLLLTEEQTHQKLIKFFGAELKTMSLELQENISYKRNTPIFEDVTNKFWSTNKDGVFKLYHKYGRLVKPGELKDFFASQQDLILKYIKEAELTSNAFTPEELKQENNIKMNKYMMEVLKSFFEYRKNKME